MKAENDSQEHLQELLRESEVKFSTILGSISDHIRLIDKNSNIIWMNESAENFFGKDRKYKKYYEVCRERKEPCCNCHISGVFQDGKIHEKNCEVRDNNGQLRCFHCTAIVALRDREGNHTGVLEVSRDITEENKKNIESTRQKGILDGINRIFHSDFNDECEEDFARNWLSVAEKMTGSEFGFIGIMNCKESLETIALSESGILDSKKAISNTVSILYNLVIREGWQKAIKENRTVLVDIPCEITDRFLSTEEQENLNSFLAVPLRMSGKATGVIGLARRISHYSPSDIETVEKLSGAFAEELSRRRAEVSLRNSEEWLRTVVNASQDAIISINSDGLITIFNPAAEKLFGRKKEEMLGNTIDVLLPEEYRELQYKYMKNYFLSGIPPGITGKTIELPGYHSNGKIFPIEVSLSAGDMRGERFLLAVVRDAREKVMMEKELSRYRRDLEELVKSRTAELKLTNIELRKEITGRIEAQEEKECLARAIEQIKEGILITDNKGTVKYVNSAFEQKRLCKKEDLLKKNICELDKNDIFYTYFYNTIKYKNTWKGQLVNKIDDETLSYMETSISPVLDKSGSITNYIAIERDVTGKIRMERELQEAHKMNALGTLAGGIAHDFNNMITAIMGYTEVMHNYKVNRIEVDAYLEKILKVCKRARDMIKNILDFSRPGKRIYRVVDIRNIIKEVIPLVRSSLPENVEIKRNIPEGPFNVLADSSQIYQVIMNLCINAAHSMREKGGILQIDLKKVIPDEDLGLSEECKTKTYIKLTVSDTGHGMERDVIERIFEPYFTTKKQGEGTGLGLALAHRFIKEHNGKVTVESIPGKGSIFNVYLPLADSDIKPGQEEIPGVYERAEAPLSEEKSFKGKGRILCVDDEEDLLYVCKFGLERIGYEVVTKNNSLNAFNLFREDPRRFDLVLTDYSMPGMTGSMLAKEIMNLRPDIPIIIYSAYIEEINREKKKITGVKKFLTKPFTIKQLLEIIRETLSEA